MSYSSSEPALTVGQQVQLVLFWAFVGIPLLWGVSQTIAKATMMFR